jgi:hypothetical protein
MVADNFSDGAGARQECAGAACIRMRSMKRSGMSDLAIGTALVGSRQTLLEAWLMAWLSSMLARFCHQTAVYHRNAGWSGIGLENAHRL